MTNTTTNEKRRIVRAMNDMPYAASITPTVAMSYDDLTDSQIAEFLEALAAQLRKVARDAARNQSQLAELQQQREAVREFLGTSRGHI